MLPLAPIAYCYAGAFLAGGIVLFTGALQLTSSLFIITVALGVLPAAVLAYWAFQLEEQYNWLIKGHAKERATEVVTPPRQFRKFIKQLETDLAHAGLALMAYERSWQRRSFAGQWYGFVITAVTGLAIGASLFMPQLIPAFMAKHLPQTTVQTLGGLGLALAFGIAIYVACALLTKAADQNAAKLAKYLEQKTEQKIHISPLHPTALFPALGIFAVLLLVPVTLLTSNFEAQKTVQQKAIAETQEAAKDLEARLGDTLEKKDYFATENAELLNKNQKLTTNLKKAGETEKLLRTEVDTLKDRLADLQKRYEAKTTELTEAANALEAKLDAQTKATTEATAEASKLSGQLNKAEEALKAKTSDAQKLQEDHTNLEAQLKTKAEELENLSHELEIALLNGALNLEGFELPATATLEGNHVLRMPLDVFFTPQSDVTETYFTNNIKELWPKFNKLLQENPNHAVHAYIYADTLPPEAAFSSNFALTAAQAAKLAEAFYAEGATAQSLFVSPMGNALDIDSRLDPDALAANRRVEFMLLPSPWPALTADTQN